VAAATASLNREVFAEIGLSPQESRTLSSAIETLRRNAGDF
jgi:hypothetical protein